MGATRSGRHTILETSNVWPYQWPKTIDYPQHPVFSFLDHTAERVPNRLAIIFEGTELTFCELKNLADCFANALASLGLKKGERVAIHLPNCPQFAIAYYGILKTGAVFTPISPLLSASEIQHQLDDSEATFLISSDVLYPNIASVIRKTKVNKVITTSISDCHSPIIQPLKTSNKIHIPDTLDMADLLKKHRPEVPYVDLDVFNDLAHIAYTGGTTGRSKGVMLTHYNVVVNTIQTANWWFGAQLEIDRGIPRLVFPSGIDPNRDRVTAMDREAVLVVVPWFHAMGTIAYLNEKVFSGHTMAVYQRFNPKEFLDAILKYKVTVIGGAPQLYFALLNHPEFRQYDLSEVRLIDSGAAPLSVNLLDKMLTVFNGVICEGYGLTECTMMATANPPDRSKIRQGSVGIPVFDTECKIVDLQTGEKLPPEKEGEICIKGPQVMQGYWKKPSDTAKVLKDDWLFTGDIGKYDKDGYLYITDRKKDVILYNGYNVYPRELEEIILLCFQSYLLFLV